MNLSQRGPQRTATRFDWLIAIFLLIVQQGAFLHIPVMFNEDPTTASGQLEEPSARPVKKGHEFDNLEAEINPLNTAAQTLSLVFLTLVCLPRLRRLTVVAVENPYVLSFLAVILLSVFWSLHPDITFKRASSYFISMWVVIYLVTVFPGHDLIRVLIYSLMITALGSIGFILLQPGTGIMSGLGLEGSWRGVFIHKNMFGEAMSVAVFAQLYLLAARVGWGIGGLVLAAVFYTLVVLSRSSTSLIVTTLYLIMFVIYYLWSQHKGLGYGAGILFGVVLCAGGLIFAIEPDIFLAVLGKDATLTGRTVLWTEVLDLINQKPWLGWGYQAMFYAGDPITSALWSRLGWKAPGSHNAFLELALDIGYIGLGVVLLIIGSALWRGWRCCVTGVLPLGYFALVYFMGTIINGWTESSAVGQNQDSIWLVFTLLMVACGHNLNLLPDSIY